MNTEPIINQNNSCHICYYETATHKCHECPWQICNKCQIMLSRHDFQNCPHCHRPKNFINMQDSSKDSLENFSQGSNNNIYCQCIFVYFKKIYYRIKTRQCINKSLSCCKTVTFDSLFVFGLIIIIAIIGLIFQFLDHLINKKPINFNQTLIYSVFGIGVCAFIYTIFAVCYDKLCKKPSNQTTQIYVVPVND